MQILKELETVRWTLSVMASQNKKDEMDEEQRENGCFETGYECLINDAREALTTIDSILKRDPAELVDYITKAMFSETFGFDSFTQEKMRSILDKQAKAALRALGLMPESEQS